jgi:hypothetical protein
MLSMVEEQRLLCEKANASSQALVEMANSSIPAGTIV